MLLVMQDNNLAVAACSALSHMSFIAPDLVLPLVQTRFQVGRALLPGNTFCFRFLCSVPMCCRSFACLGNSFCMLCMLGNTLVISCLLGHTFLMLCTLGHTSVMLCMLGKHFCHVIPAGSYICYAVQAGQHLGLVMPAGQYLCYAALAGQYLSCAMMHRQRSLTQPPGFWLQKLPVWRLAVHFFCFPFS